MTEEKSLFQQMDEARIELAEAIAEGKRIEVLETKVSELEKFTEAQAETIRDLNQQKVECKTEIARLQNAKEKLESEVKGLKSSNEMLERDKLRAKCEYEGYRAAIRDFQGRYSG